MSEARPSIVFSVDVEDWPQSSWNRSLPLGDYCADNLGRVLDLMGRFPGTSGTFFVLGKFAERHPGAVRAIRRAGHEIASHGYGHVELFRLDRDGFADDLRHSTEVIAERRRRYELLRLPRQRVFGRSAIAPRTSPLSGNPYGPWTCSPSKRTSSIPASSRFTRRVTASPVGRGMPSW